MTSVQELRTRSPDFAQVIEHKIMQRTWGRIHRLKVDLDEDRVIVSGCTSCYYVKQLALEGILDVVGQGSSPQIELDIEVSTRSARTINRGHDESDSPLTVY